MQKSYTILVKNKARKELLSLSDRVIVAIEKKIDALAHDPRPPGCKKLKGTVNYYRIRIGNYRVIYSVVDHVLTVIVIKIASRKESYK